MARFAFPDPRVLQADATCTLLQRAIPQAPPPHPFGLHKPQRNPRLNYWWLRRVRLAEGACEKKASGSSRTQIRTCQADGAKLSPSRYSLPSWRRLELACHACYTCKNFCFLVLKSQAQFVSHPPSLERGFYFPLFSYGMQLLRLFCQVEK